MTTDSKLRLQIHVSDSHIEMQYMLMSYGIPQKLFLYDQNGQIKQEYVDLWIDKRRRIERRQQPPATTDNFVTPNNAASSSTFATTTATTSAIVGNLSDTPIITTCSSISGSHRRNTDKNEDIVDFATEKDVLLGRGVPIQSHPGNVMLCSMIEERWYEFHHQTSRKVEQ